MALSVYLNFSGNCREAVHFYAEVFETRPGEIMTYGQMPDDEEFHVPEEMKDQILHTHLDIMGTMIMCSDVLPGLGRPLAVGNQVSLVVVTRDRAEIERLYQRLGAGGTIEMPLQETFFSGAYASLTDRFGVSWMLDLENG